MHAHMIVDSFDCLREYFIENAADKLALYLCWE